MINPSVSLMLKNPTKRRAVEKSLASKGTHGDSVLAHISPAEALMLQQAGGVGTANPKTGLPQFYDPDAGHADPTGSAGTHRGFCL